MYGSNRSVSELLGQPCNRSDVPVELVNYESLTDCSKLVVKDWLQDVRF